MIGRTISHYQITEKLGEGGMGVVYKARDSHLKRFVALKVLPPEKVADLERKQRFVQEARSASALNHPNIVTVYDIDQTDGVDFIAMEYIEGKTLGALIGRKGLKLSEALKYAVQIADALAKAHAAGIVHRDLKPGNVMVTAEGRVKVLDFGLAKLTEPTSLRSEDSTLTQQPSETGPIVGTAGYMSPEQAEGKKVDARSDVFSFGSVLYEMLTGRRAFGRDSLALTLAAILHQEPPPLPAEIPRELESVVAHCLRKDQTRRFQHIDDVKIALEDLKEESESGRLASVPASGRKHARRSLWMPFAAAALAALAGVWWNFGGIHTPSPSVVPLTSSGTAFECAFSPDGNLIAFPGTGLDRENYDVYVQQIGAGAPLRLTTDPGADRSPVFSPDGRHIAFTRDAKTLILIPALGGPERTLGPVNGAAIDFSPDGKSIAVAARESRDEPLGIFLVSVDTGNRRRLTCPRAGQDEQPRFSPDGRIIAFDRKLFIQWQQIGAVSVATGETKILAADNWFIAGLAWMHDGREVVYASTRRSPMQLWAVSVSGGTPRSLSLAGENAYAPATSRDGRRLAYVHSTYDANIWRMDLPVDRNGQAANPVKLIGSTRSQREGEFSPDGKHIAFGSDRSGPLEIWVSNADGTNPYQLTFLGGRCGSPRWSPDSRRIAFDFGGQGNPDVYVVSAEGGAPQELTRNVANDYLPSWSSDGQWIYFTSNRTGREEIWRMPPKGGRESQLTHNGGYSPQESPDGTVLYYLHDLKVWRIPPEGGDESPVAGSPSGLHWYNWRAFGDGIYFIQHMGKSWLDEYRIQFFDFASEKVTSLGRLEKPFAGDSVNVSPDRRQVIFGAVDRADADIVLVENFR